MGKKFYRSRLPACGRISSSSTAGPLQPMKKRYRGNDTGTTNAASLIPYPRSSTERPGPPPAPPSAGGRSADSDDLRNAILAKFCQGEGILYFKLPNDDEVTVPVTHKLHLASPSVGYGLLEPKARDALKVELVAKAKPRPQDQLETAGKDNHSVGEDDLENRYAVERVRLFQLSQRSPNEWLNFFETMYRHLEDSGCNASVDDLGNLKIIWGQLLNVDFAVDDFRVSLSDAIGRFLLALQSRCLQLKQRDWDLAYDWILGKLMKPRCLNRLMRPLLEVIIENKEKRPLNSSASETKTADAAETAHKKKAIEGATASSDTAAEAIVGASETADQKLLGQLTRLMCAKDETVLNRALLPMARELAPSETNKTLLSLLHCRRLLRHIGRRTNGNESTEANDQGGEGTPSVSSLHVMPFSLSRRHCPSDHLRCHRMTELERSP